MSQYWNGAGLQDVGSYQIAGFPFVTGSTALNGAGALNGEMKITFPRITKSMLIINKDTKPILVHFDTRANTNVINQGHYIQLDSTNDAITFEIRTKEVYISMLNVADTGKFQMIADLTTIDASRMLDSLSGSGINNYNSAG